MTKGQWMIIAVGALVLAAHALFPPRVYEHDTERSAGRAFVFSSDFYDTDITSPPETPEGWEDLGGPTIGQTSNPCVMGWVRFVTTAIAIVAATVLCVAVAGAASKRQA